MIKNPTASFIPSAALEKIPPAYPLPSPRMKRFSKRFSKNTIDFRVKKSSAPEMGNKDLVLI
jgi:hypothetical protein